MLVYNIDFIAKHGIEFLIFWIVSDLLILALIAIDSLISIIKNFKEIIKNKKNL